MSDLFNQMTTTTNGMVAHEEVGDAVVSLFFKIATARGADMSKDFLKAFAQDPDKAIRVLLWSRDVRGGAGERQRFRDLLSIALDQMYVPAEAILLKVPEIGRYDDLHVLVGTKWEELALSVHLAGIKAGNGLACKWAPRKGKIAEKLRTMWDVSPKFYRKHIVQHTKVVEQLMCAGKWDEIEYSHVPSVASGIYGKAFQRHDSSRYAGYLASVVKGEAKMNASAIFPYDIYRNVVRGNRDQADAQWSSLPNYLQGVDERIIVMSDVSGSMTGLPMDISVSLGLYFAERLEGEFKNCLLTFSERPSLFKLEPDSTLSQKFVQIQGMNWGMSTNLEAAFDVILQNAVRFNVPQDKMPTKLLIISDMQFNSCVSNGGDTALEMARRKFAEKGYKAPSVIFWNAAGSDSGNAPARFNETGVALVSGASPAVVQSVLGGEIDPVKVMLKTIMKDRYTI